MTRCTVFVLVSFLVASAGVQATSVEPITFDELVRRAERIFVGEVVAVEALWDGDAIRTRVTFRVSDTVKGRDSGLVQLTFLGGQVGEVALEIGGMPKFAIGDEEVIFAVDQPRSMNPLVGFWHGRVRVSRERATGRIHVLRHDQTPFVRGSALTEAPAVVSAALVMPMTLDAFLTDVRQVMRSGGAR